MFTPNIQQQGQNQNQQNRADYRHNNPKPCPKMIIHLRTKPHSCRTCHKPDKLPFEEVIWVVIVSTRRIIARTENHDCPEYYENGYNQRNRQIPGFSVGLKKFFHIPSLITHSLKCLPLCSKLSYISQLAQAGERRTVSPGSAAANAIFTHSSISLPNT